MSFSRHDLRAPRQIPIWVDDVEFGDKVTGRNALAEQSPGDGWREQPIHEARHFAPFLERERVFSREALVPLSHTSAIVAGRFAPVSQFDHMVELVRSGVALPHGLVCLAGASDACHGYHGRGWSAVDGNLHLSVHWTPRVAVPEFGAGVLALGANACASAVDELVGRRGAAGIKWVNDVLVGRRKIAGVLAWAQSRGAVLDSVVLGIGLNVERVPVGVADAAVEGATAIVDYQSSVALGDALGALLRHLDQAYVALVSGRVQELVRLYRSRSVALGRRVRWVPDVEDSNPVIEGKAIEIRSDLSLVLEGHSEPLRSGRIAFA